MCSSGEALISGMGQSLQDNWRLGAKPLCQSVVWGLAASASSSYKWRISGSHLRPKKSNMHLNNVPLHIKFWEALRLLRPQESLDGYIKAIIKANFLPNLFHLTKQASILISLS